MARRLLGRLVASHAEFDPSLQMKTLSVDRNARVQIPREKPRAVRVDALPFGGTNLHRLSDGSSHLEASARPANPTSLQSLAQRSSAVWASIVSGGTKRSSSRACPTLSGSASLSRTGRAASGLRGPRNLSAEVGAPARKLPPLPSSGSPPRAPSRDSG